MPNPLGSLLKKKRTKDKDTASTTTSSSTYDNRSLAASSVATASTTLTSADSAPSTTDSTAQKPGDVADDQSPLRDSSAAMNQHQQHGTAAMPNIMNPADADSKTTPGQTASSFATLAAPLDAEAAATRQMADGTWPIQRDDKATKGKYHLEDFDFKRTLGTGSFGRVHMVQSKHNQRFYAVKVLKKAQVVKMKQVEHTNDERRMLAKVKHPFLVTLWGTFSDAKNLYMVMDFVEGGELFSLLRKSQVGMTRTNPASTRR